MLSNGDTREADGTGRIVILPGNVVEPVESARRRRRGDKPPWLRWVRWVLLAAVVAALALLFFSQGPAVVARLVVRLQALGVWAAAAFIAIYAVATVAFVPGSLLTLAGGALFGLGRGTLYVLMGATLGAGAAFLIARHAARGFVERRLARDARLEAIDRAIAREGRKIVLLLRLSPVFPFVALNYSLGLTRIRFLDYLLASAIGMVPGTLLYVYSGKVAGEVALAAGGVAQRGVAYYVFLAVGLLATIVATAFVTRLARKALREATS